MKHFLTTTKTAPPPVSTFWFIIMMALLVFLTYTTLKYYTNPTYRKTFKVIQAIQLVILYTWYFGFSIPFANSLPLYHCRLAMFAVLLLPDKWPSKQYFALMGASGAIFALVYPVFDPYDFPHITSLSFLVGHYALFVNSLLYLLSHYDKKLLNKKRIVLYTFVLNLLLLGVNQVTGGNYGLLAHPPMIKGDRLLINYLAVSIILAAALVLFDEIFKRREKRAPLLAKERMKP
ncbi:TIGR02206 family membrane protein [Streptococcus massiliensis]|uniref:Major facilitator superfamily permease n=1 Tax=Streptococcus massiliensis TaxID=313439 RepID=A0A380L4W7_9STRE|nr:TIGR02206 family membrane protein [Streptococcus massiliensis]SUN77521.1 major facilitator superfamily permease [Streptococcus massiliensis]